MDFVDRRKETNVMAASLETITTFAGGVFVVTCERMTLLSFQLRIKARRSGTRLDRNM